MNNYTFSLLVLAISISQIAFSLFYFRPIALATRDAQYEKTWKLMLVVSVGALVIGLITLLLPPELWWPAS